MFMFSWIKNLNFGFNKDFNFNFKNNKIDDVTKMAQDETF